MKVAQSADQMNKASLYSTHCYGVPFGGGGDGGGGDGGGGLGGNGGGVGGKLNSGVQM